jgi:hypothetical protein
MMLQLLDRLSHPVMTAEVHVRIEPGHVLGLRRQPLNHPPRAQYVQRTKAVTYQCTKGYLSGLTAPLPFTPLQTLEVGNAFELGVFRGLFSAADAAAARANL